MNEKEAIETYKNFLDDISKNGGCTIDIDFQHKKEYEAMWEILNFIEKCKSNVNAKNKRLKEYVEEVAKKDKIINLMAEKINQAYFEEDDFEEWFEKMLGVQKQIDYGYVVDLIKQYFERGTK